MGREGKGSVGFIGIGTMGREMVINLLKAGHAVRAFDLNEAALTDIAKEDATRAANPADAAREADIVITMLPDTPHVEAVIYGEHGLLQLPPPAMIDSAAFLAPSGPPETGASMKLTFALPRSAWMRRTATGEIVLMSTISLPGGEAEAFAKAEPFFRAMGTTIKHVGASGAGQTVKLCNQLVCGINIQAICEALALGRASGVDLNLLREVLISGAAGSWMLDKLGPQMIEGHTGAGFRIDLMFKDLRLVQEHAQALNVPLPGTALVTSQYVDARAHGEGANGNQALFRVYDRMTNQTTG